MISILGRANSLNVRKVTWCAAELGLEVDRSDWGRGYRPTNDPEFTAKNPNAKVPVLVDGGESLWESNAIVRYLCASHAPHQLGDTAMQRAQIDKWLDWQLGTLMPTMFIIFHGQIVSPGSRTDAEIAAAADELATLMAMMPLGIAAGEFARTDHLTAADYVLGPCVYRYFKFDIQRPPLPEVERYAERLLERPAYREHVALPTP